MCCLEVHQFMFIIPSHIYTHTSQTINQSPVDPRTFMKRTVAGRSDALTVRLCRGKRKSRRKTAVGVGSRERERRRSSIRLNESQAGASPLLHERTTKRRMLKIRTLFRETNIGVTLPDFFRRKLFSHYTMNVSAIGRRSASFVFLYAKHD